MENYIVANIKKLENIKKREDTTSLKLQEIYKEFYTLCKDVLNRHAIKEIEIYPFPQIINNGYLPTQVDLFKKSTEITSLESATVDKLLIDFNKLDLKVVDESEESYEGYHTLSSAMSHYFQTGVKSKYYILENSMKQQYSVLTFDWELLDIISHEDLNPYGVEYHLFEPFDTELKEIFDDFLNSNLNIIMNQSISVEYTEIKNAGDFDNVIKNEKLNQLKKVFRITELTSPVIKSKVSQVDVDNELDELYTIIEHHRYPAVIDVSRFNNAYIINYLQNGFKSGVLNPSDFPILSSIDSYTFINDTEYNDCYPMETCGYGYSRSQKGLIEHLICNTISGRQFVLNVNIPSLGSFGWDSNSDILVRRSDITTDELSNYYKIEVI